VEAIAAVLFEPVGCLAEFRPEEFDAAAAALFAAPVEPAATGSGDYWRLNGLMAERGGALTAERAARLAPFELRAVEYAQLYEDVRPALEELRRLGVAAHLASSLSRPAVARFIERFALADLFAGAVSRDDAGGVMAAPLRRALEALDPRRTIYLVDTAEALEMTRPLGLNAILMFNDYDQGRMLAERNPAGGVVSLAELADALRLIEQRSGLRRAPRPPLEPFELFDPT